MMRDRVTGVGTRERAPGRVREGASSGEIEQEIRRTRARISATLDDIEGRLAPARLKRDLKHAVQDTINDVRDEYNPKKMARQAGNTVIDTIRDHPLAATAAGVSISYLIMKGVEDGGRRPYPYYERPRPRSWQEQMNERSGEYGEGLEEARRRAEETGREIRHRASEMQQEAQHRVRDVQHRAEEYSREAAHRSRDTARRAQQQARRTGRRIEDFVYDNPLAAGAVAIGIGALIGGLFPSTEMEDRYLGPSRDEAIDRARDVADETMERGKEAGRRVAEDAKEAARDVARTAKSEAENVGKSAQESARGKTPSGSGGDSQADRPATRAAESATERGTRGDTSGGVTESGARNL